MVETFLSSPLFVESVLPFLLVFTIVFAILQKTSVLGKGKKQIDAIVSLVIGLIVITFGHAVGIIVLLVPFLAVSAVIILVFMLLYGMVYKEGDFDMPKRVKGTIAVLAAVAVVVFLLVVTGAWDYVANMWFSGEDSNVWNNVVFVVVIIGAILTVIFSGKGSGGGDK